MSIPALTPELVTTSPSSTKRWAALISMVGSIRASSSICSQCVVAGRPQRSPAAAYTRDPVHTLVMSGTVADCRRTHAR